MDLSSLSPEEIEELKAALAAPQEDPIQTLASAMELLMAKVESIETKVDEVCKVVYDDFIGGIKDLANEKAKADRIGGLKSTYGGLFSGYGDYLGDHLDGDPDGIYPLLADRLDELKDGEGFDEKGEIERIAQEIGARVAKLTGKPVTVEAAGKVEEAKPDGASGEIGPGPEGTEVEPKPEKEAGQKEHEQPTNEPAEEDGWESRMKKHLAGLKERGGRVA